jgi:hypothetical protein
MLFLAAVPRRPKHRLGKVSTFSLRFLTSDPANLFFFPHFCRYVGTYQREPPSNFWILPGRLSVSHSGLSASCVGELELCGDNLHSKRLFGQDTLSDFAAKLSVLSGKGQRGEKCPRPDKPLGEVGIWSSFTSLCLISTDTSLGIEGGLISILVGATAFGPGSCGISI